jgi:hypothetical protein
LKSNPTPLLTFKEVRGRVTAAAPAVYGCIFHSFSDQPLVLRQSDHPQRADALQFDPLSRAAQIESAMPPLASRSRSISVAFAIQGFRM